MKKTIINVCLFALLSPAVAGYRLLASGLQQSSQSSVNTPEEVLAPSGQVTIDGHPVLTVYESVASLTPQARAQAIEARIVALARDTHIPPDSVRLQQRDSWTEILAGNTIIMAVTNADATIAGTDRQSLALQNVESIRKIIQVYRQEHSWRMLLQAILKTALATLVLLIALWLVRRLRLYFRNRIERQVRTSAGIQNKSPWHLSVAYLGPMALAVGAILRWIIILALLEAYLAVTLGFYYSTRDFSLTVTKWTFSQLETLAASAVDYLPNLLVVAAIAVIAYYAIRLVRLIFSQIRNGDLKIRGFYPDWAQPTDTIIRILVLVLALIVAFPYLPGAKSPAFRGISIFVGVLLSFGSTSAVANAIGGVILTYMRSFLIGDWVQIGDTMGEVVERTLLVTRVLTPKAEIITIPNSAVMNSAVKNYSTEANKAGVIFHTIVSISYDTPWRTVHQLLSSAALATSHVLQHPAPFVLQSALNDFYVSYELNAYTDTPREVLNIFSELHQNIQDRFNEAGVEICSPHFSALRDGNVMAIPEQYIKPDYRSSAFQVSVSQAKQEGNF